MLTSQAVRAKSWHVWVQEAELPWRPALLRGVNPLLCVSVTEPSLQNTWFELCSPITADLFPFEKYLGTLYSLFALSRPQSFPENVRATFPVLISTVAVRCATNLRISMAPRDCSHADLRVILVEVTFFPQGPEV